MIITAWRITKSKYIESAFTGEGAEESGGRWNSEGTRMVYASSSVSLAILEILVNLSDERILSAYQLIPFRFDQRLMRSIDLKTLPDDWAASIPSIPSKAIGDEWVRSNGSLVLEVPSAVVPLEKNYLVNPRHPDFSRITIDEPIPFPFDIRLIDLLNRD